MHNFLPLLPFSRGPKNAVFLLAWAFGSKLPRSIFLKKDSGDARCQMQIPALDADLIGFTAWLLSEHALE